jgi:BASS family bile acid:Na+ symporter
MFDWYPDLERVFIPLQLVVAMLGMGATLRPRDFGQVVRHPAGVTLGAALQWILVPGLAWLFAWLFDLGPGWAVGLVLIAVAPGGALSNLYTFLSRGHTPLSIAVTLVATLGCLFTIPFLLKLLTSAHLPPDVSVPVVRVLRDVTLFIVAPLAVGMAVLRGLPRWAPLFSSVCIYGSLALVLTIALGSVGSGRITIGDYGWAPPLIIVLFSVTIHLASAEVPWLLGRYDDETVALSVEVTVRNCGVSILFVPAVFSSQPEQGQALYSLLFFAGIAPIVPLATGIRSRLGRSPLWFRAPRPRPGGPPGAPPPKAPPDTPQPTSKEATGVPSGSPEAAVGAGAGAGAGADRAPMRGAEPAPAPAPAPAPMARRGGSAAADGAGAAGSRDRARD